MTKLSQLSIYRQDPWKRNLLKQSLGSQKKQIGISSASKDNYAKVRVRFTSSQPSLFSVFTQFLSQPFMKG